MFSRLDGTTRTETSERPGSGTSNEPRGIRVEIVAGRDAGQTVTFGGRAIIGRGETADLRSSDPTVSTFHAELLGTTNGIRGRDLGSHNGTLLGSTRVGDAVEHQPCVGARRDRAAEPAWAPPPPRPRRRLTSGGVTEA